MGTIFQFKEKRNPLLYLVKLKTDFSRSYLDSLETSFLNCIKMKSVNKKVNFVLHLKPFNGNSKSRCFKKRISSQSIFIDKTRRRFLFSTPSGSFIKGNLARGYGVGRILEQDVCKYSLLYASLKYCFLYNLSVRIHAALVGIRGSSFLLAGHGGVGKSTLCGLLKGMKEFKVLGDDECFAISNYKNPHVFSLSPESLFKDAFVGSRTCSSIFFVQLDKKQESKVYPLSKKDAFKRIIFHSEFPKYEDDKQIERRIENLKRLISQCKCFLLINGKDLKENPEELKALLYSTFI